MASDGMRVICEILRSHALKPALRSGLTATTFQNYTERELFRYIDGHYRSSATKNQYPTIDMIKRRVPAFEMVDIPEDVGNIETLVQNLRERILENELTVVGKEFIEAVQARNIDAALDYIFKTIPNLSSRYTQRSSGFGIEEIIDGVRSSYADAQTGAAYGIPWLWKPLTDDTMGKRPGDFIVFYARMKQMKCVCEGQRIMMHNGSYFPIEDVPDTLNVPSYTAKTQKIRFGSARRVVSGVKDCVETTTESGLQLRTSVDHLFMVPGGEYTSIKKLKPGDYVATARTLPDWKPRPHECSEDEAAFIGLSLSYEYFQGLNPPRVPQKIFRASHTAINSFLTSYFRVSKISTDTACLKISTQKSLLQDIQHLLMRFSIRATLKNIASAYQPAIYQLEVLPKNQPTDDDEIFWEKIVSIKNIGRVPCYDICITDGADPNFVVEGFIVHNTWLLIASAVHDYLAYNQRVLFWSREMSEEQVKLRMGSVFAGVDYQLLKKGGLPGNLFNHAMARLEILRNEFLNARTNKERRARRGERDLIILCGKDAPTSLDRSDEGGSLQAVVEEWEPDITYLDSFYHMKHTQADQQKQYWARIQCLSEALKDFSMDNKIPVVANAQANRLGEKLAGENLTEVAGSDAIAREADLVVRILKKLIPELYEPEYEGRRQQEIDAYDNQQRSLGNMIRIPTHKPITLPKKTNVLKRPKPLERKGAEICLLPLGNREGTLEGFTIEVIPGYRFAVIRPNITQKEAKEWLKKDIDAADREIRKKIENEKLDKEYKYRIAKNTHRESSTHRESKAQQDEQNPTGMFANVANKWKKDRKITAIR